MGGLGCLFFCHAIQSLFWYDYIIKGLPHPKGVTPMNSSQQRDQMIVEETRRRIKDGRFLDCPCTAPNCPRHGLCAECIAVHRQSRSSVPVCLRKVVEAQVLRLAPAGN